MPDPKPDSKLNLQSQRLPRQFIQRFNGMEALILVLVLGVTGSGVYVLQQKRIDRLQAHNQALQEKVALLEADNTHQQRAIEDLSSSRSTLTANLQLLCRQRQTRLGTFVERALGGLVENDFAPKWSQICEGATSPLTNPIQYPALGTEVAP